MCNNNYKKYVMFGILITCTPTEYENTTFHILHVHISRNTILIYKTNTPKFYILYFIFLLFNFFSFIFIES